MLKGCDSAWGPTLAAAREAVADGVTWWEVYVGGGNATHRWSQDEVDVIREAGLTPCPIWVPTYGLNEDPVQSAADAVGYAEQVGIYGAMSLDTEYEMRVAPKLRDFVDGFVAHVAAPSVYAGGDYVPEGIAAIWLDWGGNSLPGFRNAVQYGPATRYGMSVDLDLAHPAFRLGSWTRPPAATSSSSPSVTQAPIVVSAPKPPEEPMQGRPFVAISRTTNEPGNGYPHVAEGSVWVVYPSGVRSWVGEEPDVAALLEEFGQTGPPRELSGATLSRIAVSGSLPH